MSSEVIISQMTIIFMLLASGFIVIKLKLVSEDVGGELSKMVIYICSPALMINSALKAERNIGPDLLTKGALAALAMYVFLLIWAEIVPRLLRCKKSIYTNFRMMTVFANIGFIGIPVVNAVVGAEGVIFTIIFNIEYNLLFFTYGYMIVKRQAATEEKIELPLKEMINVGTVSAVLAMILYLSGLKMPYIIVEGSGYMGQATTFISLFVIGVNLAKSSFKEVFGDVRIYVFVLIRQLVLPIIYGFMIRSFVANEILFMVAVIMTAMPVGSMPMMLAEKENMDSSLYAKGVIVSTICSVITIPIVLLVVH